MGAVKCQVGNVLDRRDLSYCSYNKHGLTSQLKKQIGEIFDLQVTKSHKSGGGTLLRELQVMPRIVVQLVARRERHDVGVTVARAAGAHRHTHRVDALLPRSLAAHLQLLHPHAGT